jgi:hypothetical protein
MVTLMTQELTQLISYFLKHKTSGHAMTAKQIFCTYILEKIMLPIIQK